MIQAALEGGRIVLQASGAPLWIGQRVPGGRYVAARREWIWPATPRIAIQLVRLLPQLRELAGLEALLGTAPDTPVLSHVTATKTAPVLASKEDTKTASEGVAETASEAAEDLPEIPSSISTKPWRHQMLAFAFVLRAFTKHGAAMLAMRMGTGKSLVALMAMAACDSRLILFVCPRRVISTWVGQLAAHYRKRCIVAALDDSLGTVAERRAYAEERLRLAETLGIPFIAIINYEAVFRPGFAGWALDLVWDLVIVDESHRAKAPGGKASLFLKALRTRAKRRLMMTGTPMPHSPLDIYAQMRFLNPAIYGSSFTRFRAQYAVMGGFQDKQVVNFRNLDDLKARLHPICFRVEANVLDLPPAVEVDYECELSEIALNTYNDLETHLIADIGSGVVTAANAMVKLLRLQQVTGGALKADGSDNYDRIDTAKIDLLTDIFEDLGPDEPWVVFCRFHADLDAVHQAAAAAAVHFDRMDYLSMELSGRRDDLLRWQAGEGVGLAVQTSAGGLGVDLTRAAYSIFYSLSFSLGEYDQALSRTVRPGQTRSVTHIHLVVKNSIDGRIRRALAKRAQVVESVLDELQGLKETR